MGGVTKDVDVLVVGGGNAGFCAAHATREVVDDVLVVERAPRQWAGGNTYYTGGGFLTVIDDFEKFRPLIEGLEPELLARVVVPRYTKDDFVTDMHRLTRGRCDPN